MSEEGTRKAALRETDDYKETRKILEQVITKVVYVMPKYDTMRLPSRRLLFDQNCVEFNEKWQEAEKVSQILKDLKVATYPTKELESMSKMLAYLGLVESLGVTLLDMVLLLLIGYGHEVHTRGRHTKHVTSFEELADVDLKFKLKFLKDNDINITQKIVNPDLRNIIAHLKFRVSENACMHDIRGPGNNRILIDDEISRFWSAADTLKLVFEDCGLLRHVAKVTELSALAASKKR